MKAQPLGGQEKAALACLAEGTPAARNVLSYIMEKWNGLTDAQRGRVYEQVEKLHTAGRSRRAGPGIAETDAEAAKAWTQRAGRAARVLR